MAAIRETRAVQGFDRVALHGWGDIRLVQGEEEGLVIEAEPEVIERIKSVVVEGRLELGPRSWQDGIFLGTLSNRKILYHLSMKNVHGVSISGSGQLDSQRIVTDRLALGVSGAGKVEVGALETESLEMTISGSGKVQMGGKAQHQEIRISGHGTIETQTLDSQEAAVHISGSGEVALKAEKRLDVHISGSGRVQYLGSPEVHQHITGMGRVNKVEAGG